MPMHGRRRADCGNRMAVAWQSSTGWKLMASGLGYTHLNAACVTDPALADFAEARELVLPTATLPGAPSVPSGSAWPHGRHGWRHNGSWPWRPRRSRRQRRPRGSCPSREPVPATSRSLCRDRQRVLSVPTPRPRGRGWSLFADPTRAKVAIAELDGRARGDRLRTCMLRRRRAQPLPRRDRQCSQPPVGGGSLPRCRAGSWPAASKPAPCSPIFRPIQTAPCRCLQEARFRGVQRHRHLPRAVNRASGHAS